MKPGSVLATKLQARRTLFVVIGLALVTLDGEHIELKAGEAVDIPTGSAHRVENRGDELLVFVEVQRGDYFGEDDIVRLEDDYGRG